MAKLPSSRVAERPAPKSDATPRSPKKRKHGAEIESNALMTPSKRADKRAKTESSTTGTENSLITLGSESETKSPTGKEKHVKRTVAATTKASKKPVGADRSPNGNLTTSKSSISVKKTTHTDLNGGNGEADLEPPSPTLKRPPTKAEAKGRSKEPKEVGEAVDDEPATHPTRKRKAKEEKEADAMPHALRTPGLRMFIGAHVSIAKGVENAVTNSVHIGGNAFALFLQSQRKWENKPLANENRDAFRAMCKEHSYDATSHVLPHGSYLVNLAQEEPERAKQAYKFFLNDLQRCEALGIKLYNFHPGASGAGKPLAPAITRLANKLNEALAATKTVVPLLENMAGSGSVIGARFSDLRDVIAQIKPEYRSRIGVCIDTCHAFAAGYDLRTPDAFQAVLADFDKTVGMQYLKALHLNDSKAPFAAKKDLHQNIGLGFLGLRAFHSVMNEPRFQNMPLILETPCDRPDPNDPTGKKMIEDKSVWAHEIKLLESLIGMDVEGAEFKKLERELRDQGQASRGKMEKTIADRDVKVKKKLEKGQRSLSEMFGKQKQKPKATKSPVVSGHEGEEGDDDDDDE